MIIPFLLQLFNAFLSALLLCFTFLFCHKTIKTSITLIFFIRNRRKLLLCGWKIHKANGNFSLCILEPLSAECVILIGLWDSFYVLQQQHMQLLMILFPLIMTKIWITFKCQLSFQNFPMLFLKLDYFFCSDSDFVN